MREPARPRPRFIPLPAKKKTGGGGDAPTLPPDIIARAEEVLLDIQGQAAFPGFAPPGKPATEAPEDPDRGDSKPETERPQGVPKIGVPRLGDLPVPQLFPVSSAFRADNKKVQTVKERVRILSDEGTFAEAAQLAQEVGVENAARTLTAGQRAAQRWRDNQERVPRPEEAIQRQLAGAVEVASAEEFTNYQPGRPGVPWWERFAPFAPAALGLGRGGGGGFYMNFNERIIELTTGVSP